MKEIFCKMSLEQNAVFNQNDSGSSIQKTFDFIPGSSVRGTLVAKYIELQKPQDELKILIDNVQFTNAYLDNTIPTPVVFAATKDEIKAKNFSQTRNNLRRNENDKTPTKAIYSSFPYFDYTSKKLHKVDLGDMTRISLNTKSRHGSKFFNTQYIEKGQVFAGSIIFPEDMTEPMNEIVNRLETVYLGACKTAGFGAAKFKKADTTSRIERQLQGNKLYIYALSDIINIDVNGECSSEIPVKDIQRQLGISNVEMKPSSLNCKLTGGYNNTYKCGYPRQTAIGKGSVLEFSFDGELDSAKVSDFEKQGLGLRKQDGYGRILVNPKFLFDVELKLTSAKGGE